MKHLSLMCEIEEAVCSSPVKEKVESFRRSVDDFLVKDINKIDSWTNHENHTDHSDFINDLKGVEKKIFKSVIERGSLLSRSNSSLTCHYDHENHTNWTDK
jgi:hypothetical protein